MKPTQAMLWYFPSMQRLVDLHNRERNKKSSWFTLSKVNNLQLDDELTNYAQDWAVHMANSEKLYHSKINDIMNLGFRSAAENIAYGQKTEESVMSVWMSSAGHRRNIMNTSYNLIGCGFSYSEKNTPYWCVCFGKK